MEECIKFYQPDRTAKVRTWGTVGHVLYSQARDHYGNAKAKQRKILQLADKAFQKELEIEHDPRAVNRRAQVQILLGEPSVAEKVLYENIRRVKSSANFYASIRDHELQESYRISFYLLGSLILGEFSRIPSKREEAISLLTDYIAWSSPDFYQTHVALSKRGTLHLLNGQFELAEKDFGAIDPDKLEPKVNVGFLRNNQFRLWASQVNKAIATGDQVSVNEYWDMTEEAFQEAQKVHGNLQQETDQVYYDRIVEIDLKRKYETEFRGVLEEYYRLKSALGR